MKAIALIWKQILKMLPPKESKKETTEQKMEMKIEKEKEPGRKQPIRLTQEVRVFLQEHYDFRYNILVSSEQGHQKSTFCKALMPSALSRYYTDNLKLLAQGKAELDSGTRHWFTKEEERELQRHNAAFYHPCPAEEVFHACFCAAEPGEEGYERLSASDIFRKLKMYNSAAMRRSNPATFAQVLLAAGVTRKHTKYGNVYLVKPG